MPGKQAIGQDIDSYCGKCKTSRDQTIMTLEGEAVARVRCEVCGSMHKFRDPIAAQKVPKPRTINPAKEAVSAETYWAAGMAAAKGKERDYSVVLAYRVGDIVNLQTFVKGVVIKLYANKCDMLFKDKERLIVSTNL